MKKIVFRHNRKQHILTIATGIFVALPMVCFPLGLHEGMTPNLVVARAYKNAFGTQTIDSGEVVLEDWALVDSVDQLVSSDYGEEPGEVEPGETPDATKTEQASGKTTYSDIPSFIVSQQYDSSNLPIELLDPSCFAPDESTYYVRANQSILKEKPNMDSKTLVSLHLGQEVTRTGVGDTWSRIRTEAGKEGFVLTNSIQDTMVSVKVDRTVWVDTGSLVVRKEPSTNA